MALLITANCDAVPRGIGRPSTDRLLWVDSICIDQTPERTPERNQPISDGTNFQYYTEYLY